MAAPWRRLKRSELRENPEVFVALELEAARLAAVRHTEEDLDTIDRALGERTVAWQRP